MTDHLKASPPERYEGISRPLLEQAQDELDKGDILLASDKVWGATAQAIKAVCQRMGWYHHAHNHLDAAVNYLPTEMNRNDLLNAFGSLESLHSNYYEHQKEAYEVGVQIDNASFFTSALAAVPLEDLPSDQLHLTPLERQGQERLLRLLPRRNQYFRGAQLDGDKMGSLPPVNPLPFDSGESNAG